MSPSPDAPPPPIRVRFRDLSMEDPAERRPYLDAIEAVMAHGQFLLGPEVVRLEQRFADYCGRRFAVGVGSGTDALFFAIRAAGIGAGDEVIVPALSWIASANAIAMNGAVPVFCDIGADLNIDPNRIEPLITKNTKAILAVHFTGVVCAIQDVRAIAQAHDLLVIEDAAQSFGAHVNGAYAGSFGDLACFSMNPMKILPSFGEAGMVLTDDEVWAQALVALRYNGMQGAECREISLNSRIDTLQCAVLHINMDKVEGLVRRRREIAEQYRSRLSGEIGFPEVRAGHHHTYYSFQVIVKNRDHLQAYLVEQGIETQVQHPMLMPDQSVYRSAQTAPLVNARRLVGQTLCLPVHEKMSDPDVDYVIDRINRFLSRGG